MGKGDSRMPELAIRSAVILALIFAPLSWAGMANAADRTAEQDELAAADSPPPDHPEASGDSGQHPDSTTKEKWKFATLGYVWLAGVWGKTDVIGPAQPVDVDLPFNKVLKAF